MGLNNFTTSTGTADFTDVNLDSTNFPSGYTIDEDAGDLVVRDTTGTVALRRVDGGNWSFAGNTVEANQLGTSATPATVESDSINNSGTVETNQVGTSANPATVESDQITNSGQVTTQDLTVNGSATGVGGGASDAFRVFLSSSFSQQDTIPFDTIDFDTGSNFDLQNSQFIAPDSGVYIFAAGVQYDSSSDLALRMNVNSNTTVARADFGDGSQEDFPSATLTQVVSLSSGDNVTILNDSGGPLLTGSDRGGFSGAKLF
jgi:hypothetical protein